MVGYDLENSPPPPSMLQTRPKSSELSQNVPESLIQTHRCPNGFVFLTGNLFVEADNSSDHFTIYLQQFSSSFSHRKLVGGNGQLWISDEIHERSHEFVPLLQSEGETHN